MSILTLPSGKEAKLKVNYGHGEVERMRKGKKEKVGTRLTSIKLTITNAQNPIDLEGESNCVPEDNFNKTEGKRLALKKLFNKDKERVILSKADRQAIVKKLCPCFFLVEK